MTPQEPNTPDQPQLQHRNPRDSSPPLSSEVFAPNGDTPGRHSILPKVLAFLLPALILLVIALFFGARIWARHAMRDSLPQLDGSIAIPGLAAPVTVQRDAQGVPHIRAASLDDLVLAQGYITAQDRLWQMETLRRHATGSLAEVLGASLLQHDRTQRTLQLALAADHALATLPPDQLYFLELYARGVNASIAAQRPHLPLEFRLLNLEPAPWTPRDSLLVSLVMFQDLTTGFPTKLTREAISTRLPPALLADLYPVGSWRDHPPGQPAVDLTAPRENIPDIPLDESQTKLEPPKPATTPRTTHESRLTHKPGAPCPDSRTWASCEARPHSSSSPDPATLALLQLQRTLTPPCDSCTAGSNNWVVSGAHTATGKPLLSNDMHLSHGVPGIWYETSLESPTPSGTFHVAGVALPGTPFIIVGHNDHIAWGFTNLGADVQDIYVERTRPTSNGGDFQSPDGAWHPIVHRKDVIHVRFGKDVSIDLASTRHGDTLTPIISNILGTPANPRSAPLPPDSRTLALRWTIYDPANISDPFLAINSASDWTSFCAAFSSFGGPSQNVVYADDQGHIGYHAVGKVPLRGSVIQPSPLSPVPVSGVDPAYEWSGYIPFDQLPKSYDPPGGILATANARVTPDNYSFPITLNWTDPYRNERIWKVLSSTVSLTPEAMLHLQTDVYSDLDHVVAQRLAYAIDHAAKIPATDQKRLHQAADILRSWNGNVDIDSPAPAIVDAARLVLWPILLRPHLGEAWQLYGWGEKTFAEEQIIMHTPARWLPPGYANWDDLLAATVEQGLVDAHAPADLTRWPYGKTHVVDIEHPVFSISPLIGSILGVPTGTGPQPQSGNTTTVKQVGRTFGPSERFTADLNNLDNSTLNIVLGQSGDPLSPWFLNQFSAWYKGTTFPLPYTAPSVDQSTTHTLTLTPQ